MLLIDNEATASVLRMPAVVDALERAYRDLAAGEAVCRPRIDMSFPIDDRSTYRWGTMEGGSAASGYYAIRMKSDVLTYTEYGGTRTQEKHCVQPGTYCGLVLLLSTRTGEPLAILNDGVLQHMRVGADSAIGTKYAAREDARVLGMLGSGGMARSHLEALLTVRPLERVQVYSPTEANREQYAREMAEQHGLEVVAVDGPRDVFRGADIVAGCTDAAADVVIGDWLEPGTHVTCIGGRPDARARQRFDAWLRLGTAPAPLNDPTWRPTDEYLSYAARPDDPVRDEHTRGTVRRPPEGPDGPRLVALEDVLDGSATVRTSDAEITFSERGNIQGAQFFAVAGHVYEQCRERGLGRELPTAWFLQDIRD
ncbi:alanine dehydrogenase [Blastococcus sp. DSM 46786]|uniref:ornithine cyclodeaminase family protein n=1 Tax=Blastococcus sp. DSM 46786 TaxID=1798227 RepID=UPI0008D75A7B|nr:ornithine cyclodeaminase family protein [Blastococcus sp. DSM 46786]SEK92243.1 alanine dehydrogenase [Blastococcus sp. DSM 46786]